MVVAIASVSVVAAVVVSVAVVATRIWGVVAGSCVSVNMRKATGVTAVASTVSEVAAGDVGWRVAVVSFSFTASTGAVAFAFTVATLVARIAGGASVRVMAGLVAVVTDYAFHCDHCWIGTCIRQWWWEGLEPRGSRVFGSFNCETAQLCVIAEEFAVCEDGELNFRSHRGW